jgi:hypothetical protein
MLENGSAEEGLLVRAEPLEWAQEISHRMVDVVHIIDGALLLDADPAWLSKLGVSERQPASRRPCIRVK